MSDKTKQATVNKGELETKAIQAKGIEEELDMDELEKVSGGGLRATVRTQTQDISGDTASKI